MDCAGAVVTFNYNAWSQRYPEFAITEALAQLYFNEATLYMDNTGCGPVQDLPTLTTLLNMVTAHIAWINAPQVNGQPNNAPGSIPGSPLVGRIGNATQGSVSVQIEMPDQPGSAAWWQSTKYGAAFWQATAQYRMFRYQRPHHRRGAYPFNSGFGWY